MIGFFHLGLLRYRVVASYLSNFLKFLARASSSSHSFRESLSFELLYGSLILEKPRRAALLISKSYWITCITFSMIGMSV